MAELTTTEYADLHGVSARTVRRMARSGALLARRDGRRWLVADRVDLSPGSPEWVRLMSASKVAAVLGVSPYQSPYSLWHEMKGLVARGKTTEVQSRGHYLEAGVLAWWRDKHPEADEVMPQYTARLDDWGIATCDAIASSGVAVEIKTSGSWDEWGAEGTDEVPAHYYAQAVWQLACLPAQDITAVHFAVLGPRLDFREYVVERDDELIASVVDRCRQFYDSLEQDTPPPLDDHTATLAVLRRMHPDIEDGAEAVIPDELAAEYVTADLAFKDAEVAKRAAQSRVLAAAGTAQYIHAASGLKVARRQPNRSGISLVRVAKTIPTPAMEAAA